MKSEERRAIAMKEQGKNIAAELERRIVRRLDGALPDADTAELYRELMRDPQSRAVMDDYAANDALAREALVAVLGGPGGKRSGVDAAALPPRDSGTNVAWW